MANQDSRSQPEEDEDVEIYAIGPGITGDPYLDEVWAQAGKLIEEDEVD